METETVILAIRQLCSRRGTPNSIWSDCAKNFTKADVTLQTLFNNVDWDKIQADNVTGKITWNFISAASPHQGGAWESMVKLFKQCLKRTIGSHTLAQMEFITVLAECELIVNNRPLTAIEEGENMTYLTPNKLLMGFNPSPLPDLHSFHHSKSTPDKERWKLRQQNAKHFWNSFRKLYMPLLQVRQKWNTPHANIKVGDIVLIHKQHIDRQKWPLGKVLEAIPGRDGRVRSLKLKTANGEITRAIQSVYPLEGEDNLALPNEQKRLHEDASQ